jgi:hypothetical protein
LFEGEFGGRFGVGDGVVPEHHAGLVVRGFGVMEIFDD